MTKPALEKDYLAEQAALMLKSYKHWTGDDLTASGGDSIDADSLFEAPIAVLCHGTEDDPLFNYGNKTALELFEMSWDELIGQPSRVSAEPASQEERSRLLEEVSQKGFIDNYKGVRISKTGKRFLIERAIVWNVISESGTIIGQAAALLSWTHL